LHVKLGRLSFVIQKVAVDTALVYAIQLPLVVIEIGLPK
jgi:hypothetical protein